MRGRSATSPALARDPQGRVVAAVDHFSAADRDLIARVPIPGERTVYAVAGGAPAWAGVAGPLLLPAPATVRRG